ncbi:uncharacterized protein LOC121384310 isoform X2 [Gigantopelta aegis]|uniref:uncharacterized protein LOC121384310 isoform X2 n=1 Tax=Gigantopelta aegis TaxID=1735272 RepID=UPI001B88B486|nr:uncharacterized protein LOC121384310 isoform X2 [Gigantopelta aegis]
MHLVNGVSCWHHPIPKDVPVLGCGCHPRAAGAWSIVHGSSDLVTLGKSCDCRIMAPQLVGYSSTSLSGLQHPDGHPSLDLRQSRHLEKLILLSPTTQIQFMRLNPDISTGKCCHQQCSNWSESFAEKKYGFRLQGLC